MEKDKPKSNGRPPVVFIPGGISPAAVTYGPLLEVLKDEVRPLLKDLEVYAAETPPPGYGLEWEIEGIRRAAEAADMTSFHFVEYSGGLSLAFTARYPEWVRSLALIEPGWIADNTWRREEAAYWSELGRVMALPPEERLRAGMALNVRPGVQAPSPPPGPPPPWMARRVASGAAMYRAYNDYDLGLERLRQFRRPVYLALGTLSPPIFERNAKLLRSLFPDIQVEVYEGRQHLDPPHRAEPERLARALRELWARSEVASKSSALH
jgi:pimeloyl-ACP methyl ester carboxylesterase